NLLRDLAKANRRRADNGLPFGDAVAHLQDVLFRADRGLPNLRRQLPNRLERASARAGELADFVGNDGEALSVLAGARGFDRGVEREKVRLSCDRSDGIGDLPDSLRLLAQLVDRWNGLLRHARDCTRAL